MKIKKSLNSHHELEILATGNYTRVIGIDEVGRGCWAGPVAVGLFVFDFGSSLIPDVNDSKKLTKAKREEVYSKLVLEDHSVLYGSVKEINNIGISGTIEHLIHLGIEKYHSDHTFFIIDGLFTKDFGVNTMKVIKGDTLFYSIAAASILAKVERDKVMEGYDKEYPQYGFSHHKGYGTKEHHFSLQKYGITPIHRKSYKPIKKLL